MSKIYLVSDSLGKPVGFIDTYQFNLLNDVRETENIDGEFQRYNTLTNEYEYYTVVEKIVSL